MFEDPKGALKCGSKLLVVVVFEWGLLIRLQKEEHLIPFVKMTFGTIFINLRLYPVLSHYQIILDRAENVSSSCEGFTHLEHLRDPW